jgi:uncharacterized protein YggL (DUF469 family)
MAKNSRSRRLRKKLHLDEFQELGFDVEVEFNETLAGAAEEELLIAFIEGVIEPRGLIYGGGVACVSSARPVEALRRKKTVARFSNGSRLVQNFRL